MTRQIKEEIIQKLNELPVHLTQDDVEHVVRCPYCGDSHDPTHGHLYIKIDLDSDEAMPWNCFKCGAKGKVTDQFLYDLGIDMTEGSIMELRRYNKSVAKLTKKQNSQAEHYVVTPVANTASNRNKVAYVSQRIGVSLSLDDVMKLKMIPSVMTFLAANQLTHIDGVEPWRLDQLERFYVGFLSSNNNLITFRRINDNPKLNRYYKATLNSDNDDGATFYSIPSRIDLMSCEPLHVHIAEGIFDILSIQYNMKLMGTGQRIMYASCGYSYTSILRNLASFGLTSHLNVHIYADADKSDKEHMELIRRAPITAFAEHYWIHRNATPGQKDYGVPQSLIKDRAKKIW